jgi:hypothetical protein
MHLGDTWVVDWWQPAYAIVPAVAEETWVRLLLTTLIYALLRPAAAGHPRRAVLIAVLAGCFAHSIAHTGFDPLGLLIGGLLYGIPSALLYIKFDFESVMGYHFLMDFIRFGAALYR